MRVAPESMGPAVALPIIGNSNAADESAGSVDNQNFSMRPEVNAREMNEAENLHGDTGAFHQLNGASMYRITSERILKEMHFHAVARAFGKRFGKSVRDFALAKEEIFKCDCTPSRTDAVQHRWKDLIAVFQWCNFVPFQERRSQ